MRALVVSLAIVLGFMSTAAGQTWPNRTVTFVIPLPAGGIMDVMARPVLDKLRKKWGKPGIVENKPGATGTIGAASVARAAPDGHTLLFTVDLPITMAPNLMAVSYNPLTDFELIATFAETEQLLVVNPSLGIKTFDQLVARAKAEPGKLTYGTGGLATPAHLCIEGIAQAAGTSLVHVPYRGAAPAMNGLVAGEVDMFCGPLAQALPFIASGKLVPIASSGTRRSALTLGVPTLIEAGLNDFTFVAQYYLMAPKGTPADVVARVRADFKAVLAESEIQARYTKLGIQSKWIEGDQGKAEIKRDLARWGEMIRKAKIKR